MKELIEFNEFLEISKKLEIKTGQITHVEEVPKSDKLIKLTVDFGEETKRTVVTNIKPLLISNLNTFDITGHKMLFITNLKPVKMMGIESTAMIMPGELEKGLMVTVFAQNGTSMI
jgi:methionyl-tRNA synthetase